jgi:hypothetical protein
MSEPEIRKIVFKAPPTLARFMKSNAPVRLCVGPVGSGKSSACVMEVPRRASETPFHRTGKRLSRFVVIRNTYPELRDTTIRTFMEWIPDPQMGAWSAAEHKFHMKFNDVDAEILFRALDRPEDVKKLLSLELTGAYINEGKEVPRSVFDMIQTRVGRYPRVEDVGKYWNGVWIDTNPPDTDHYLYKIFEEERPEGFELFHQPSGLAPDAENLDNLQRCWMYDSKSPLSREAQKERQIKNLASNIHEAPCICYYPRLMRGKAKDWIDVNVHSKWGFVQDGKPIFPEFQDSTHVQTCPLLPSSLIKAGNDFGLTPAAVFAQRDPRDGQLQIMKEYVSERMGAVEFGREQARIFKTDFRDHKIDTVWGDPAGNQSSQVDERTPFEVLRGAGLPAAPVHTNDFELRIGAVKAMLTRLTILGRPALVIDPACKMLRKAMNGGYCFRRLQVAGDERFEEKPNKNIYSHVAEALQYLLLGEGEDSAAINGGEQRSQVVDVKVRRAIRLPKRSH